jgi:hypothetical protein
MLLACVLTNTSHQLALARAAAQLTTVSTCPLLHTAGTHVGIAPQSLISFQVAQSKTAKCQLVELAGQTTSHVLVVYPLGLLASYGVYHKAFVTSELVIPVINPLSLFKSEISSHG